MRHAIIGLGLLLTFGGCAALTSAKGTADSAKGTADDAKSQKDSATASVKDEKDKAKGGDASGGGGAAGPTRLEATDGQINVPISDKIDVKKGKQNDWRKFTLAGKPGQFATFELHWDEESANLSIDVYDKFGVNVGKSPRRIEGQSEKKVLLRIDDPGLYYVRVSGPTKTDSSIYTMMVRYHGPSLPPPSAAATPAAAAAPAPAAVAAAAAPAPAPCPPGQNCPAPPDPNKVYGTIVSMVRQGSTVTLYLDKGSADQLRPGMMGTILDGPDGDKPFEGGSFSIAQVLGGSKSIAKSSTLQKPLGKNNRVVVNLK